MWPMCMIFALTVVSMTRAQTDPPATVTEAAVTCPDADLCRQHTNSTTCMCSRFSSEPGCECSEYFTGDNCTQIDLRVPLKDVYEHGIRFIWEEEEEEICLDSFAAIFTRHPPRENSNWRIEELESNYTMEIDIGGMDSDAKEYFLCIITEQERVGIPQEDWYSTYYRAMPNCGVLETAFANDGAFSLAFIGIAVALGIVVLGLMVAQTVARYRNTEMREKILADVMGTIDRLRPNTVKKGTAETEEFTGLENRTYTDDEDVRLSGPHSDPSVRA